LSIAGITSNASSVPFLSQAGSGSAAAGTSTLFQQLAADAQAVLLRGSGAAVQPAAATGSGVTGSATSTGATPEQQVATDLQSFFTQLQSMQAGSDPSAQSATETQTASTDQPQPHHHHHRHQSDGSSADANSSGGTSASSSASASQSSTPNGDQSLTEAFAASIGQALQAYSSQGAATTTISLTV
jgi:hypothetical protein